MAHCDFRALVRLWRHTSLSRTRKLQAFDAVIKSKLLYGLAGAWLNTTERRRLDGFQNRCLRVIWGIKPAYVSRISNRDVLEATGQGLFSSALHMQQLLLFGKAARSPEGSIMREAAFCPGSLRPTTDRHVRKVGRPRLEWTSEVHKLALLAAGGAATLEACIMSPARWRRIVELHCHER